MTRWQLLFTRVVIRHLYVLRKCNTVFDLADVSDEKVADRYLKNLSVAYRCKLVFVLDLRLKATELPFLAPVVERRDEHDDQYSNQDGDTFDPFGLGFGFVMCFLCSDNNDASDAFN